MNDLYGGGDSQKTMYGYSSLGETKKRSLHSDDEIGTRYVYFDPQTSGTLSSDEIWGEHISGTTVSLTGNILVPSGTELTIQSGLTVQLNGYYIKSTGGTITRENNVSFSPKDITLKSGSTIKGQFPTISTAISNASSGQSIYLASGTYSGNLTVDEDVDIIGAGMYNTTINGSITCSYISKIPFPKITDLYVYLGITVNSSDVHLQNVRHRALLDINNSDCYLTDVTATSSSGYIDCYNSWINSSSYNSNSSADEGVVAHYNSDLEMADDELEDHSDYGLNVYSNTDAELDNTYFSGNDYDIYAGSGCYVDAEYVDTWSDCPPPIDGSGTVDYDDCSMAKRLADSPSVHFEKSTGDDDPAKQLYRQAREAMKAVRSQIAARTRAGESPKMEDFGSDITNAINDWRGVIVKHSNSAWAPLALNGIARGYLQLNDVSAMTAAMSEIAKNDEYSHLKPYADSWLIRACLEPDVADYKSALSYTDDWLKAYLEHDLAPDVLYGKGILYANYLDMPEQAEAVFKSIVETYPDHPVCRSAIRQLRSLDENYQPPVEATGKDEPAQSFTIQNHPNPFNPDTHIRFALPEAGQVRVVVYDIQGRMVTTLLDGRKAAGQHTAVWDGLNSAGQMVASGTYFYQVMYNDQVLTKKMLLVR